MGTRDVWNVGGDSLDAIVLFQKVHHGEWL